MDFRYCETDTPLTRMVRGYLSLEPFSTAVKPPKYPERGRGFTVKPLPSFLLLTHGSPRSPDTVLQRLRVCRQRFAKHLYVALIHHHRPRIDPRRHGGRRRRAPVFELVHRIVMQVIGELDRVVCP